MADKKCLLKFESWKAAGLMIQWMTEKWSYMSAKGKVKTSQLRCQNMKDSAPGGTAYLCRAGDGTSWKLHKRDI